MPPEHRSIVVVDVAGFTSPVRTMEHQVDVHKVLYDVLRRAFNESDVPWEECYHEDRGDGVMILVPPHVSKIQLADQLPDRILAGLRRSNATKSEAATVRLRVALHFGEVLFNENGVVSQALNLAFRILDAPAAKSALEVSAAMVAFIASDDFYNHVITQDAGAAPDSYRRISVVVKSFSADAWLRLRGGPVLPGTVMPDAWDAFLELCTAEVGPDGLPPALVFLALLAYKVDEPIRADLVKLVSEVARKLDVEQQLADRLALPRGSLDASWPRPISGEIAESVAFPAVWGTVPPRNLTFTGRADELEQLDKRLVVGGATAVPSTVLHGIGGIGKTQLVVEYIYRRSGEYDLVWWIDAAGPARIRSSLTDLAQRLGLPSQDVNTAVPAVLEALRTGTPYRRWLLVFDSAESPEDVRPFFPTSGNGEILITSRNPYWAGTARPIEMAVFGRAESIELLRRPGSDIGEQDADRIAGKLGDLPLAIQQAGAWLAMTGMQVHEYLRLFDEKVIEVLDTRPPTGYDHSVATAWNWSFDELKARHPAAFQLLQICAFLAPEPISRDLFTGVRRVSISPELDVALRDPMRLGRVIQDINRYSLAKIGSQSNTLLVHRLVQAVLRNRMSPQQQADLRHVAHQLLADMDPDRPSQPDYWPVYQKVLPHSYSARALGCDDLWVRRLVTNLAQVLYFRGDHEEAVALLTQARATWSERLGESHQDSLRAAAFLGPALRAAGRFKQAAVLNNQTMVTVKEGWGDSAETVAAQLRVTADLAVGGEFAAARADNERIYRKTIELYGEEDPLTLEAAYNLAVTLRLCGEFQAAFDLDKVTYQRRVDVLGHNDVATLKSLSGLHQDYLELGDYETAQIESERLAERLREILGEDSAETLRCAIRLAVAMRKRGLLEKALAMSGATWELATHRYGADHPTSMAAAVAHAIDLQAASPLSTVDLGEQTLNRYCDKLGTEHPYALACMINFGGFHGTDVLERCRRVLGTDHPTTMAAARNLDVHSSPATCDIDPVLF